MRTLLTSLFGLSLLAGCASPPPLPPAPPAPPAPLAEAIPKPPVTTQPLTWQPSHQDWTGTGYVWVGGRYIDRAMARSGLWQPGYWTTGAAGWAWMPAHWL